MIILRALLVLVPILLSLRCEAAIVKRDEHALVIPLAYDPTSRLMTATISIGNPSSDYNLIVDTGSPFLNIQSSSFHTTSSTIDPHDAGQPDMSGASGYFTTDPNAGDGGGQKPQMHFVTDSAYLVENGRAGGGAKGGNVTVGLSHIDGLKLGGILGLSPPFSKLVAPNQPGGGNDGTKGKKKRDSPALNGGGGGVPSLDVSFLHTYLSDSNRKTICAGHFYLALNANPPSGNLVFPLTGNSLPTDIEGYDFPNKITIDPSSGSTFPHKPYWGIAHRPDLRFALDGKVLENVRVDAMLLDSGTSGIVGPPSEVAKIFTATGARVTTVAPPKGSTAMLGKAACSSGLQMAFDIGGKRAAFETVRQPVQGDSGTREAGHIDFPSNGDYGQTWAPWRSYDGAYGPMWAPWKSYVDEGVRAYAHGMGGFFDAWRGLIGLRKRHLRRRMQVGTELVGQDMGDQCEVSLVGSAQVEKMFPGNGPDFKVWIVGVEFFQRNLVYHNVDTAQTVIVPKKEGQ
ncbi:Aspartic peptidase domain protein [Kalmanozyma brasiliensis GHG001]|uniref:Peptidase A1 domain-containing protein n=1 Tax=Kalmanozyma brasiliensis (strain GHG001) TaxID=1365824 RepID=V5EWV1_KALBG|nr:Aspartic peptidase domain protein [Kalmanozyma brasiliensis GHG001]EST06839.1 Aspartic peptidase domain protein [Kalmanozyma brasiliensis GHG001]